MVNRQVKLLCSSISHMPLHFTWAHSGITEKYGFELITDITNVSAGGRPAVTFRGRAEKLLDGTYDFISGLHHETYVYRAKGDKRFVYLAQTQNDWDDRIIAAPDISSPLDLEGKSFYVTTTAPCVFGNLKHSLRLAGVDVDRIQFVGFRGEATAVSRRDILGSVLNGEVAAASIDLPYDYIGEKLGLHRLDTPSVPVIHNTTLCANQEWVARNEETTMAVLKSLIETIHYFKTQKSEVCAILERHLAPLIDLRGDDEIEHLHAGWAGLLSPKPYPHPLAVWNVYNLDVAHDPAVNFIGPFEIWDTSMLRDIDDSGFIDQLYQGAQNAANPAVNVAI